MKIFESIYKLSNDPERGTVESIKKVLDKEGRKLSMKKIGNFFKNAMMECFSEKFSKEWKIEDIHLLSSSPYIKIPKPLFDELRVFLGRQKDWAVSTIYYRNGESREYYRVSYLGDKDFSSEPHNWDVEDISSENNVTSFQEGRPQKILDVMPNAKWTVEIANTGAKKQVSTKSTDVYESIVAHLFNNQGFNESRAKQIGESANNLLTYFLTGTNFPIIYEYFSGLFTNAEYNSKSVVESTFSNFYITIRNSFELLLGNNIEYSRKGSDKLKFLLERGGSQYEIVHSSIKTIAAGETSFHTDEIADMFTGNKGSLGLLNDDVYPADIICYRKSEASKILKTFKAAKTKEELIYLFDQFYYGGNGIKPRTLVGISLKKISKINSGEVELITISNREDSDVIVDHRQLKAVKLVPCQANGTSESTSYINYEFEKGKDNKYFSRERVKPVILIRMNQGSNADITKGWTMEAQVKGAAAQLGKGSSAFTKIITGKVGNFRNDIVKTPVPFSFSEFINTVNSSETVYIDEKMIPTLKTDFESLNTKRLTTKYAISNNILAWTVYGGLSQKGLSTQELKMFTKMSEGEQIKYMFAKYLAYCAHCPLYDGNQLVDAVSGTYLKIC